MKAPRLDGAIRQEFLAGVSCVLAWFLIASCFFFLTPASGQKSKETEKKTTNPAMHWDPPNVDGKLNSLISSPPCVLSDVLQQVGGRAKEMEENLSKFTADETIRYESFDQIGDQPVRSAGTFEYAMLLTPTLWGASVRETRTPAKGTKPFPASEWDRGLPGLALIFLPKLQTDYEMKCDGQAIWNDQPAWVIHFQQREGVVSHALAYADSRETVYMAKLKGRAWITVDSGEVVHLETALMEGIPAMHLRNSWLSIDYAPVQFHIRNVRIWLPKTVQAYAEFDDLYAHRMVIYHSFTNFMLFTVQTNQLIQKPTEPQ